MQVTNVTFSNEGTLGNATNSGWLIAITPLETFHAPSYSRDFAILAMCSLPGPAPLQLLYAQPLQLSVPRMEEKDSSPLLSFQNDWSLNKSHSFLPIPLLTLAYSYTTLIWHLILEILTREANGLDLALERWGRRISGSRTNRPIQQQTQVPVPSFPAYNTQFELSFLYTIKTSYCQCFQFC